MYISTVQFDQVKNEDYPLDITDENECFHKIDPKNKDTTKANSNELLKTYQCDFEADTSCKVHKPFLNVTQSLDGKIIKHLQLRNSAIKFLNFLPDNAVVYFHNISYDWCMFNSNVKMI